MEVIEHAISETRGGYGPIFVASSNSSTDYEMLTIKSLKLGLIINRLKTGDIDKLSKTAAERMGKNNPKYVLKEEMSIQAYGYRLNTRSSLGQMKKNCWRIKKIRSSRFSQTGSIK